MYHRIFNHDIEVNRISMVFDGQTITIPYEEMGYLIRKIFALEGEGIFYLAELDEDELVIRDDYAELEVERHLKPDGDYEYNATVLQNYYELALWQHQVRYDIKTKKEVTSDINSDRCSYMPDYSGDS